MDIQLPDGCEKYILFQRTEYLVMPRSRSGFLRITRRIISKIFSFNLYVNLEAFIFRNRIRGLFNEDMNREYSLIKEYLPKRVSNILDIGCGVAGIDAILYKHFDSSPNIFLLDKTSIDKNVYYNFEGKGAFYNSLSTAKELLLLNGVNKEKIHIQEVVDDYKIHFHEHFDLIISLISWGFHYPVSTYLDQVYKKLNNGGSLMIDVRKGTDGEEIVSSTFGNIRVIFDGAKHKRILAIKK